VPDNYHDTVRYKVYVVNELTLSFFHAMGASFGAADDKAM
jgi:hypothetical protein